MSRLTSSIVSTTLLCLLYGLVAVVHTWPLAIRLSSALPGLGLGDNASFVWNFWWMREALHSSSAEFLRSPMILAPLSAPLVLHTHTAVPAWIAATALSSLTVVEAYNVVILGSLILNGLAAFTLALQVTGRRTPSIIAGLLFLLAPAITERMMGHLNLVLAWPLVFFVAAFVRWWKAPGWPSGIGWSSCVALTLYCDYYYTVYAVLFALVWITIDALRVDYDVTRRRSSMWIAAAACAALALLVGVAIAVTDRSSMTIGGVLVTTKSPRNALTAAWIFVAATVVMRWRVHITRIVWQVERPRTRLLHASAAVFLAATLSLPVLVAGWHLWRAGEYVTQPSSLKSSPTGIDVATFMFGPPFSGMAGERVRAVYQRLGLDPMDGSGWLSVTMLLVFCWSLTHRRDDRDARTWLLVAAFFAVWALGPYLMVLGTNTGALLPQAAARLIPIVNNARMPSRAMTVVAASGSVLLAVLLARHWKPRRGVASACILLAAVELLGAPLPMVPVPDAGVYRLVAADPTMGAVLTVPFGVGDGFGDTGVFDRDVLLEQTVHGHPVVGGFVARLPRSVTPWYLAHEPYATLIGLSSRGARVRDLPTCGAAAAGLELAHVRFVVLYRANASPEATAFVTGMPVEKVADDSERSLYRVRSCDAGRSGTTH